MSQNTDQDAGGNAFVYMVECRDGSLYTGWTTDAACRVRIHNSGQGAKYTRSRLPVALVYLEKAGGKSAALRREAAIKKLSHSRKRELIGSDNNLCKLSFRKNTSSVTGVKG